jgi:hypothetical protein
MLLPNILLSALIWSEIASYYVYFGEYINTFKKSDIYPLNDPDLTLTKVHNISNWYDPVASCMIQYNHTVNDTYWSVLYGCQRNHSNTPSTYRDGFGNFLLNVLYVIGSLHSFSIL